VGDVALTGLGDKTVESPSIHGAPCAAADGMSKAVLIGGSDPSQEHRLRVLDGCRAISILLVLTAHMMPLGPRAWGVVDCTGMVAMSLFFTLSGFLITRSLLRDPSVPSFLIRRLTRILPLAWLASIVYLAIQQKEINYYLNTLLFTINSRYWYRTPLTSPFWSLCVEVHFYLGIALVVWLLEIRWLSL
jgi:peptidoglycan/LPS O-acetylase OafA/YrhL